MLDGCVVRDVEYGGEYDIEMIVVVLFFYYDVVCVVGHRAVVVVVMRGYGRSMCVWFACFLSSVELMNSMIFMVMVVLVMLKWGKSPYVTKLTTCLLIYELFLGCIS